ncbi:hypothetical protein BLNAU_25082 [Blattamonas nauphoetae]|uniref:Uncharacterized protein n=1 Tax=Blattamonas nauphoetae TaxID=2049346 RepID=A0ABQ9WKK6_9EUKA|nr:hypothetical protein BLNAU_25082 [Blattamonas nauphoetae]
MTDAWSSTFYHVKKPCFPASYIAEAHPNLRNQLSTTSHFLGSPTSAGGRKASVASPAPARVDYWCFRTKAQRCLLSSSR